MTIEPSLKINNRAGNPQFVWRLQLAPSLAGFLRRTPEGDIVMPAVADTGEGAPS